MRTRPNSARAKGHGTGRACLGVLLVAGCLLAVVGLLVLSQRAAPGGAADLNPLERIALSTYLSLRAADLNQAAGADDTAALFTVEPGETAGSVAQHLASEHLVTDANLLNYYWRYTGLDQKIEAGDFTLRQTMPLREVAQVLTDASARQIPVRLIEGWRLEQMAEALAPQGALSVSYEAFMAIAGPGGARPAGYAFLEAVPPGVSLEGFLFPDTYLVGQGASADDLINKMLANFQAHLPADYESALAQRGLTLYQAVTVASLIEREARVDEDRPLIASVVMNRLAIGQPLEIDATVQYALGASGNWWPPVAGLDFRAIASPYNTYYVAGLPAGPIANPGLSSLLAALHPAETNYLYYRALCDGSGRHAFAATYEEHLANACP